MTTKGDAILTVLREKGPLSPGALAKALSLKSTSTLAYQIKPLLKSGVVLVTGTTHTRQFSLPPRLRAKEAP